MLGQSSSDRTGLLPAQVQRDVLGAGELLAELGLLGLVVDGQHAGDALADDLCVGKWGGGREGRRGMSKLVMDCRTVTLLLLLLVSTSSILLLSFPPPRPTNHSCCCKFE